MHDSDDSIEILKKVILKKELKEDIYSVVGIGFMLYAALLATHITNFVRLDFLEPHIKFYENILRIIGLL